MIQQRFVQWQFLMLNWVILRTEVIYGSRIYSECNTNCKEKGTDYTLEMTPYVYI